MKLQQSSKFSRKTLPQTQQQPHSLAFTDSNFPTLQISNNKKFSDWFPKIQPKQDQLQNTNETLLTTQELLNLTTELITKLKTCRTRMDQFQVITELAVKYINNV